MSLKVLIVHNRYRQSGGEDTVVMNETALLKSNGIEVVEYIEDNKNLLGLSPWQIFVNTIWSNETYKNVTKLLHQFKPDVVHCHNTFLRISPSVYYACKEHHVPVVQTLHNYRLLCPAALFYRSGRICEECYGKFFPWPALIHGCWRDSRLHTMVPVTLLTVHRYLQTWQNQVDVYVALTEFGKQKFISGGIPREKVVVKPNFTWDPGYQIKKREDYVLYVGRLSREKGIYTLLNAWLSLSDIPLKIVGSGPLLHYVQEFKRKNKLECIEIVHQRPNSEVIEMIRSARFLVVPSECYESFPMAIVESFSCGTPVVAPKLGSMGEIISDGITGLLFEPTDSSDLALKIRWAWCNSEEMLNMGFAARQEYERKYSPEKNYQMLLDIYEKTINEKIVNNTSS
jgi:glycosyltransferase involved in cell wall biosynthesis